ncbi:MAG: aldehyde dehydrogenase family protein, partial [Pseudomonadota bacterium]
MSAPVHAIPAPGLLAQALDRKRRACHANAAPELELRHDRLDRAIALLTGHQDALCEAMDADFGGRPQLLSKLTDIVAPVRALRFARRHLRRWMRPQRRRAPFPLGWLGARAWVEYQPKGVVGIISPWNYPVALAFSPLAGALAAGNRVMLKPSEQVPATSALINHLVARYFDPDELSVWQGGPEVGKAFAALPFDHLLFTGSGSVGRSVLAAAAE